MRRKLTKILAGITLAVVVLIGLAALLLEAGMFSKFRRSMVASFLSDQIGQELLINDDVKAQLGIGSTRVFVSGVRIPSENIEDRTLAEMDLLEFDFSLISAMSGKLALDFIKIQGIRVDLTTRMDGTTSWSEASSDQKMKTSDAPSSGILANEVLTFLRDKTVEVQSVNLTIENQVTGFEFDYDLDRLTFTQSSDNSAAKLAGSGFVNDLLFEIDGALETGRPSVFSMSFGQLAIMFETTDPPIAESSALAGHFVLSTNEIGDLFDVLQLERVAEGRVRIAADLISRSNRVGVSAFNADIALANDVSFAVTGSLENLLTLDGLEIGFTGDFFPEGENPRPATTLRDLVLTSVKTRLTSVMGAVSIRDMLVETNMFETDLQNIGPLQIGGIRRSEDGKLELRDIELQLGPIDAPYVRAKGQVTDVLNAKGIELSGSLNGPSSLAFPALPADDVEAFGSVVGRFDLSDSSGELSLSDFELETANTSLWSLHAEANVAELGHLEGSEFELDIDIPNGAAFLAAMQAETVDVGPLRFTFSVTGLPQGMLTKMTASIDQSTITKSVQITLTNPLQPVVRGEVHSDTIHISDLDKAVEFAVALGARFDGNDPTTSTTSETRKVQSLVIAQTTEAKTKAPTVQNDRDVQPLVLHEISSLSRSSDDRTLQPLVIEPFPLADVDLGDLLDPVRLGRSLDLEILINIEKVEGQKGFSGVDSKLISQNGKASFGPVEFHYGGGYFNFGASMDFVEKPDFLRIFGATAGWDFGEILEEVGFGIQAYGKLSAQFDIAGRHASAKHFADSVIGTVNISMNDARIHTSLLELAGLGLFPWLFSKELQKGYTDIVCVKAPLRIRGGKASANAIVLETRRVQLVSAGTIDWSRDLIAMRGEPRPVGRALNRSPWPFEVSGRLTSPDFRIVRKSSNNPIDRRTEKDQSATVRIPCVPDIKQTR